jgi:hypothetical protein
LHTLQSLFDKMKMERTTRRDERRHSEDGVQMNILHEDHDFDLLKLTATTTRGRQDYEAAVHTLTRFNSWSPSGNHSWVSSLVNAGSDDGTKVSDGASELSSAPGSSVAEGGLEGRKAVSTASSGDGEPVDAISGGGEDAGGKARRELDVFVTLKDVCGGS